MNQKKLRCRHPLLGILLLLTLLVTGLFLGSAAEISYGKTETVTSMTSAGKKKKKTTEKTAETKESDTEKTKIEKDGTYTSKEDVAAYIHEFECLPSNYITKKEAQELGWDNRKGNLDEVAPGKSIGGDKFGNYEELLPVKKGRKYFECDIDFDGGYRGAKRIIFSNDGLIYYTEDHYKTFEQLY